MDPKRVQSNRVQMNRTRAAEEATEAAAADAVKSSAEAARVAAEAVRSAAELATSAAVTEAAEPGKNTAVNHPSYYNTGSIEVIDFIEDQKLNFHLGNAVKYIIRAGKKNGEKEIEDLQKAKWYIARYIGLLEKRSESESEIESDRKTSITDYLSAALLRD